MPEKTIIKNGIVITMDKYRRIFEDGAIVINDDKILDVDKTSIIEKKYKVDQIIDAKRKAVLPGLINTHLHSGLIRGAADDLPLIPWLNNLIWPMHKALKPEDAYAAALLSYSESIKSGTTCVLDMFRFMDRCADAAKETGIRANLAPVAADHPEFDFLESFEGNEKLIKEKHGIANGRIKVWFGFSWLLLSSPEFLAKVKEGAKKYHVGIHTHSNEVRDEAELIRKKYGKYPIEVYFDLGMLGQNTVLAHCVWLTTKEIKLLGKTGTNVAHCPTSNMKLADGPSPVPELIDAGVNVGLATDGLKENNNFDMIEEMKFASLLHKVTKLDATVMPAKQCLEMATINGAKALGLGKEIGSIEPGKKADLILINLHKLRLTPVLFGDFFNVVSHLVYAAHGDDVETVIIDGKIVMENRTLKNVNEDKIIEIATKAAESLLERRKQFVPNRGCLINPS